ncbi:MAG TPA: nucleotide sugar dehydrogenase [Geminicoccus sp.]|uniref:nucleotide sugar dehydrogenase n=1 Tax=Geminicoccus sp. TaxID=2024832 RepID=UPI002E31F30E|nr:nucleotide sugar dehydrogenase [Geminicoccus sp.]HEX2527209.1 nucleotide sugar dehydrogenase [Geminicoccus sp.]
MKIIVCGFGYVGATVAACLLREGHAIVGVDISPDKAAAISAGESPIHEPSVGDFLRMGHADGRLVGATDVGDHVLDAHMALICVGTPSKPNGSLDLSFVVKIARQMGEAVRRRDPSLPPILLVFRSTMLPGSMDNVVLPNLLETAGEAPGGRYEVAYNPEFLREGTAIADYFAPPKTVIGERAPGTAKRMLGICDGLDAPLFEVSFSVAEMVKYADNSFHALKVAYANEIGRLALSLDMAPQRVMEIFLSDTKLNISPYYLRPGAPFGGSCLPKDVRALAACMRDNGVSAPVMEHILASNASHKSFLVQEVGKRVAVGGRILLLGLTFKSDTDDLRESPLLDLAEHLIGKGYKLSIYDPDLKTDALVGANRRYVQEHLPHLSSILVQDVAAAAAAADLVVVGKAMPGVVDRLGSSVPVFPIHRL